MGLFSKRKTNDKNKKKYFTRIFYATDVHGSEVVTIEGLMQTKGYEDIERGFERAGVSPCRFCAAGKFLSIHAMLSETTNPSDDDIYQGMLVAISPRNTNCLCARF